MKSFWPLFWCLPFQYARIKLNPNPLLSSFLFLFFLLYTLDVQAFDPPMAVCQDVIVDADASCQGTATADQFDGGSSDPDDDPLNFSVDPVGPYALGVTTVTLTVEADGDEDQCTATITVEDNTAPTAACNNAIIELDETGAASISVDEIDAGPTDNCGVASSELDMMDFDCSNVGDNTVTLTVTDNSGNTGTCEGTVTVQDNLAPIAICQNITAALDAGGAASITPEDIDNESTDNCEIASLALDIDAFDCSNIGPNTVTLTVTDVNTNSSTCTATVTVVDNIPPVPVCPADITVDTDDGECFAVVTYAPTATDNCTDPVTLIINPNSGGQFPVGTTTVFVTAIDAFFNIASCTFTVTVNDNEAPTAACKNITVELDASGEVEITGTDIDNGSSDACWIASYEAAPDGFTCANVGDNTVTLTVTDNSGNTDECTSTVTVKDNLAPTAVCQNATVELDALGAGSITPTDINNGSTDNCEIQSIALDVFNFDCDDVGGKEVTLTVTDVNGNVSTCTATVTINDSENPTITCPADISVDNDAGECTAVVTLPDATIEDNCPGVTFEYDQASGDFPVGVTTVTGTATDASDNTAQCTFTVTVKDTEDPTITCPADISVENDAGECEADVTIPDATVTDNCPGAGFAYAPASGTAFPVGTTEVTATATDAAGNTATCTFDVTVKDTEVPTITCPADISVENDAGECEADVTIPDATVTDNCPGAGFAYAPASGTAFPVGTTEVTATATDAAGNTATCTFDVTVKDTEVPTITCPADISVENDAGECEADVTIPDATVADNCPGAGFAYAPASGTAFPVGTTEVTATATDAAGNTATCTFDVTVKDTEVPTITCPADISVENDAGECEADVTIPDATVADNCPGAGFAYAPASGTAFPVGTTEVTATATDAAGNTATCTFDVTVKDTEAPTITCPTDISVENDAGECEADVTIPDATVTDNCPGAGFAYAPASGTAFPVGTTEVTATATDAAGNTATCTFDVTVKDTEAPTITCPADISVENDAGECEADVTIPDATVADNCPGAGFAYAPASGTAFPVGTTEVTATATDAAGNTATCTFDVTVKDTEAPTITCPADISVENDAGECEADVTIPDATVADNCPGAGFAYAPASGTAFPVGTTEVTATATDAAGNTATCTFDVTVKDTEVPTITCPADISVENDAGECEADVTIPDATVADNCPGAGFAYAPASGTAFPVGTTEVTATATDAAGNTATCTFDVTVKDTEVPTITCPADISVENDAGECEADVTIPDATVADNCPGAGFAYAPASGTAFPVGTTEVTATATDAAGNTATCTFDVTVKDTEVPTITCPADISVENDAGECEADVTIPDATVADNCPGAGFAYVPASGTAFPVGTTEVTATATDAAGNTATCTFDVTVKDTEVPTITCPADISVENDAGECEADVTIPDATVADNCPGAGFAYAPASGTAFPVGTTEVTATATDAAGNTATCTFDVTVKDTEVPTITCPDDIMVNNDQGLFGAVVTFDVTSGDNCPGLNPAVASPASGSFFWIGTTEVNVSTTDASGNVVECAFKVTVKYNENPKSIRVLEGESKEIQIDALGPEGAPLEFEIGAEPGNGTLGDFSPNPGPTAEKVSILYTPNDDFFGLDEFVLVLRYPGGGGFRTRVGIVVLPRNNPPTITCGPDQAAFITDGAQTVPGWATGISPGPANEAFQMVTITTSNGTPGAFSVQPAIDPATGNLTYTPNPGFPVLGTVDITVTVNISDGVTADDQQCTFTISLSSDID